MADTSRNQQLIYLARTAEGAHLAATNEPPYFCFEADTEDEVLAKVREAFAFHDEHAGKPAPIKSPTMTVTSHLSWRPVTYDEIMRSAQSDPGDDNV